MERAIEGMERGFGFRPYRDELRNRFLIRERETDENKNGEEGKERERDLSFSY